ncbi:MULTISPECIES: hypothetical protein [unclassified Wolbachia]|uniref:Jg12628 protein n=1 Tax=Pararge aegeria aegeria TaxID=348720 RepID=A0A8S4QNT9_9NEOP|nr:MULTISPECIES: hypothetical protein [unclassified Wolbachia]CAH2210432.1 jg12628 [Pararge aegeria aegeria]
MVLEKLQDIIKELDESIQSKSIVKSPVSDNLVNDIKESLELIKKHPDQEKNIKEKLIGAGFIVQHECWDSFKHSLANNEPLSDKYDVVVAYENLSIIVEALKLLNSVNRSEEELNQITSLQKKMKEELEKMQQQSAERQKELEKKIEEKFSEYIESGTIDAVSITKHGDKNLLYATIKLKEDNKSTDIKISEFLNSEFCKENNIAGFLLSSGDQKEPISGYIHEGVRYYNLGTAAQYGIKFNWYVDGKEFSITLGANSDGSIRIISDRPTDADLEKNKDVRIKVGNDYLSLADAVKTCKQEKNEASSKLSQPSTTEYFRPVQTPA